MGMTVRHKTFGEGLVKKIDGTLIEIEFGDQVKKFQFPKAFEMFLTTEDAELLDKIVDAKKRCDQEAEKKQASLVKPDIPKPAVVVRNPSYSRPRERTVNSPLVGERAQTIPVYSEEEMFELIGYMATPGRIGSIEAEVPKDGRDETFEKLFPGQKYRPIELGETPSGMPNKLSPQFRINFTNLDNCPEILKKNMGKGNGACIGRINKSKFVIDIVQNYGFRFGERQDVSKIRKIAEEKGYIEQFEKGYRR